MNLQILSAQDTAHRVDTGNPLLNISIFVLFIIGTLFVVVRATRQTSQKGSDFYTGGAAFNGSQNGLAISGDYLSAAALLGVTGAIALYGYDGFLYSVGFLIALLVALVLVAEPLRNTGRFTMADVLSFRLKQRPVRMTAAISRLVISLFYLIAQMAGAGGLVALLLGIEVKLRKNCGCSRQRTDDHLRFARRNERDHICANDQGCLARRRFYEHCATDIPNNQRRL